MTNDLIIKARIQADTSDIQRQLKQLADKPLTVPVQLEAAQLDLEPQVQSLQEELAGMLDLDLSDMFHVGLSDEGGLINPLTARKKAMEDIATTQQAMNDQLAKDETALKNYEAAIAGGNVSTEQFSRLMQDASSEAMNHAISTKGAAGSAESFVASQADANQALTEAWSVDKVATL